MFETDRLRLRGTTALDGTSILRLYNDPLVTPWITVGFRTARHESEIGELIKQTENALMGCIMEEKETGAFVGLTGFMPLRAGEARNRAVTVYIGLMPEFWGKGYAYEAMAYVVGYAFWDMGMHRVGLSVFEGNERAVALYRKLGFVEEGRDRKAIWMQGGWRDLIRMGIIEDEWREWIKKHPVPQSSPWSSITASS
ncbi:hypothetical protein NLJ89_g3644 [Agrocybe chaxingu]|uniref:N-acetyltransferase domain-containing protein n=1 Tax=Agrocybe chaxingu TaxID=84603 RepID=A0A9W8K4F7_9AGAR|nr:hypothetical protein NLJ89_g3644 [Agrocybe chaxingu]